MEEQGDFFHKKRFTMDGVMETGTLGELGYIKRHYLFFTGYLDSHFHREAAFGKASHLIFEIRLR